MSELTPGQRAEVAEMIAAAIPPSRFDVVHAAHDAAMRDYSHSPWITTGHLVDADGHEHITRFRNPMTGEVIYRDD